MVAMHIDERTALSLEGLFSYADIDDVTQKGDEVRLVYTIRTTGTVSEATGEDLFECLEVARRHVARELVLESLLAEGLSEEDIDHLAEVHFENTELEQLDAAWQSGYEAGLQDAARNSILADRAITEGLLPPEVRSPALESIPAAPVAAEPFGAASAAELLSQHPVYSVVYMPTALIQHPTK